MCVIVVHTEEAERLTRAEFDRLWHRNPDGGGVGFFKPDGTPVIQKEMTQQKLWSAYRNYSSAYPEQPMILHMRIATHGSVCEANTHPFLVETETGQTIIAHNGMIRVPLTPEDDRSDTRTFIDEVLARFPTNWMDDPYFNWVVGEAIGHSKLAILTNEPAAVHSAYLVNERAGTWRKSTWFSNTFGLEAPKPQPKPSQTFQPQGTVTQYGKEIVRHYSSGQTINGKSESEKRLDDLEAVFGPEGKTVQNVMNKYNSQWWEDRRKLETERDLMGLNQPFIWREAEAAFECRGCLEYFDHTNKDCGCFDNYCAACIELAVDCQCTPDDKIILPLDEDALAYVELKALDKEGAPHAWLMD